jgi:hypothetical protein
LGKLVKSIFNFKWILKYTKGIMSQI